MVKEYPLVQICCLCHAEVIKQYTTERTRLFETWIKNKQTLDLIIIILFKLLQQVRLGTLIWNKFLVKAWHEMTGFLKLFIALTS